METASDVESLSVQDSHRDAAAEEDDCRRHEERRDQTHRDLRRPKRNVRTAAGVVAREAPPRAPQLQQHRWDQRQPDEHVHRHERVHAEQDRRHLEEDRRQQNQTDRGGQPLVTGRIHSSFTLLDAKGHASELYRTGVREDLDVIAATVVLMPWIVKGLFVLAKSRRARKLVFVAGLGAVELAQSEQARKLYGKARTTVNDGARRAAHAIRSVG